MLELFWNEFWVLSHLMAGVGRPHLCNRYCRGAATSAGGTSAGDAEQSFECAELAGYHQRSAGARAGGEATWRRNHVWAEAGGFCGGGQRRSAEDSGAGGD